MTQVITHIKVSKLPAHIPHEAEWDRKNKTQNFVCFRYGNRTQDMWKNQYDTL